MLLRNLLSVDENRFIDISISEEKITGITNTSNALKLQENANDILFENAIVFPGIINSHDHLDFNSFPQLGNKTYNNYVEWGKDIHNNNKEQINKVLQVPQRLRVQWGIYKNLLNGITTVVNHGPKLTVEISPISIFQQCNILHSVQLEKNLIYKLNNPIKAKLPVVIHIGEGADLSSQNEINKLFRWNLMRRKLIGVHAIAMDEKQAKRFKAIVWCPGSNFFLIGKTADINLLKNHTKILFGTDSTVSSGWNLWEHLQLARQSKMVNDKEIFNMLTKNAAETWDLRTTGELKENNCADIVIARSKDVKNSMNSFFAIQPEDILMVMHKGKIRMFDESLYNQMRNKKIDLQEFHSIKLNSSKKYVWGNLPSLIKEIKQYYPEAQFPIN